MTDRTFTYAEARALLPRVQQLTEEAFVRVERLVTDAPSPTEDAKEQAQSIVNAWAAEMAALGLVVKGLWLVDFDTGSGYYCWKHPERALEYYHGHDEGFAGRVRIQ